MASTSDSSITEADDAHRTALGVSAPHHPPEQQNLYVDTRRFKSGKIMHEPVTMLGLSLYRSPKEVDQPRITTDADVQHADTVSTRQRIGTCKGAGIGGKVVTVADMVDRTPGGGPKWEPSTHRLCPGSGK